MIIIIVASATAAVGGLLLAQERLAAPEAASAAAIIWPEATSERTVPEPPPRVERIVIAAVGDLMTHSPQFTSARTAEGYDFGPCFAPVAARLSGADLAIGNFETVVAGAERGFSGYPTFNAPDEFAKAAAGAGFDVLTTANNHVLDRGPSGLERTLEVLDDLDVKHTGSARTKTEAASFVIADVKGVSVAVLAYTYGMNGFTAPVDRPWMVNVIDQARMRDAVKRAREAGAEIIIVSIHNGIEYQRHPSESQVALERAMIDAGADVVLGSHPHVIQPMETVAATREDGSARTGFIIHSLGNFVSNQRERYRNTGLLLEFGFEKDMRSGITSLVTVEYVPVWVDDTDEAGKEHRVLPIGDVLADAEYPGVDTADRTRIQQAWDDTTSHLGGSAEDARDPAGVRFYTSE